MDKQIRGHVDEWMTLALIIMMRVVNNKVGMCMMKTEQSNKESQEVQSEPGLFIFFSLMEEMPRKKKIDPWTICMQPPEKC